MRDNRFQKVKALLNKPAESYQRAKRRHELFGDVVDKLHSTFKKPLAIVSYVWGAMQTQLYGWSHDFAIKKYVGIPVHNGFVGLTGAQWEYTNLVSSALGGTLLALLGGYLLANSSYRAEFREKQGDSLVRKLLREDNLKSDGVEQAKAYLELKEKSNSREDSSTKRKHPKLRKALDFVKSKVALPVSLALHSAAISIIHYTWHRRYYGGEEQVAGLLHESVFWNWSWFGGVYLTYPAVCASAYYFFKERARNKPYRKIGKLEKKIGKLEKKRDKTKDYLDKESYTQQIEELKMEISDWGREIPGFSDEDLEKRVGND